MQSVVSAIQQYVRAMVERVSGMKVLLVDEETTGIVSLVFSHSQILEHEVFLVERIDSKEKERMRHLHALCFLRPTNKNFVELSKELKNPHFGEYHLFFTNVIPQGRLEQLAACDEFEVVHQVQEFFADVFAFDHELFTLNMPMTSGLLRDPWSTLERALFTRTVEGIFSLMVALRMRPSIRYTAQFDLTQKVAQDLTERMSKHGDLFDKQGRGEAQHTVLILDRREDPVTPLLNQWTYQAMLHELIGIENHRIDMRKAPGIRPDLREIVMSPEQDSFYRDNRFSNFGDLGTNIGVYVEEYQKQTANTCKIESIEDMQRFVDDYPEFRKLSGNVSKHVAVVHELSRLVEQHDLMSVSSVEQELACTEARQEQRDAVRERLQSSSISNMERLRLVLLFALRYETDAASLKRMKEDLREHSVGEAEIEFIDKVVQYAGVSVRGGDLFQNKGMFKQFTNTLTKNLKGVENVYTQHKTHLHSVLDSMSRGKLKESSYPFACGQSNAAAREHHVLVFMVGGTTYEEFRDVEAINTACGTSFHVVLGGSTVHNSKSFLADVAQLSRPE
mmetsp:Transcript_58718/g.156972  ORF Transcript_58718/g.156972 Transcript_58718/m.156972 type:complete len:562 (-) Transcript_58718:10-1695(-)